MTRLSDQVAAAIVASPRSPSPSASGILVDRLWDLHNVPVAAALLEFVNASRTDASIDGKIAHLINHSSDRVCGRSPSRSCRRLPPPGARG